MTKLGKRRRLICGQHQIMPAQIECLPQKQTQLLLYQARQPYQIAKFREVPSILSGELLVHVLAVGLNPIDWKSAQVLGEARTATDG
jgi:NADPH:quinone reductase-like Zn-dependent oxidoreductase